MPKPAHLRVTAIFELGGTPPVEQAQCTLNLVNPATGSVGFPGTDAERVSQANDMFADWAALMANPAVPFHNSTRLVGVKVASIGLDGSYTRDPWYSTSTPVAGNSAATARLPLQIAHVASLTTARRGPTGKGRIYLPLHGWSLGAGYQLGAALVKSTADAVATLVSNINNEPGIDANNMQVSVVSTKGYSTPVTGVRMGRILDTQRSRRRSLVEDYQTATVAVTG